MRGLRGRLLVLFIAVAAVGITVSYIGFVVWGQRQVEAARRLEMRAAALTIMGQLDRPREDIHRVIDSLEGEIGISVSVVGDGVPWLRGGAQAVPAPSEIEPNPLLRRGVIHFLEPVPENRRPWTHVIASRPVNDVYDRVFATQVVAFIALALAALLMVLCGVLLARRSLLAPFERLSALVDSSDHAGLRELGARTDSFAGLGRSIAGMNERISQDREQIAQQLDQLQEAHAELSSAQAQLIRAERLAVVGTLSAGLAHEIGNPLAVVSGFTELLKDPSLALEEQESALKRIEHELDRIQSIVRDLLDFSRASSESKGECRISDALADLKGLLDPQRRFASVELSVSSLGEPVARIEKSAFLQVMVNLALNAADAMNGSGQVRVSAQAVAEHVSVRVEDSGPGVPDSDHAKVFEPFFTTKPAGLGTGLGLAVCERIVEAVGGTLTVGRSQDLGGACFELLLPKV